MKKARLEPGLRSRVSRLALAGLFYLDVAVLIGDLNPWTSGADGTLRVRVVVVGVDFQGLEVSAYVAIVGTNLGFEIRLGGHNQFDVALLVLNLDRTKFAAMNFNVPVGVLHFHVAGDAIEVNVLGTGKQAQG